MHAIATLETGERRWAWQEQLQHKRMEAYQLNERTTEADKELAATVDDVRSHLSEANQKWMQEFRMQLARNESLMRDQMHDIERIVQDARHNKIKLERLNLKLRDSLMEEAKNEDSDVRVPDFLTTLNYDEEKLLAADTVTASQTEDVDAQLSRLLNGDVPQSNDEFTLIGMNNIRRPTTTGDGDGASGNDSGASGTRRSSPGTLSGGHGVGRVGGGSGGAPPGTAETAADDAFTHNSGKNTIDLSSIRVGQLTMSMEGMVVMRSGMPMTEHRYFARLMASVDGVGPSMLEFYERESAEGDPERVLVLDDSFVTAREHHVHIEHPRIGGVFIEAPDQESLARWAMSIESIVRAHKKETLSANVTNRRGSLVRAHASNQEVWSK